MTLHLGVITAFDVPVLDLLLRLCGGATGGDTDLARPGHRRRAAWRTRAVARRVVQQPCRVPPAGSTWGGREACLRSQADRLGWLAAI